MRMRQGEALVSWTQWATLVLDIPPPRVASGCPCAAGGTVWAEWGLVGVGLLLIVATGFFVAAEFALVNLDRADLEARIATGGGRLGGILRALSHTSTHLSSAQLGITLTTLLTGFTMEPALSHLLISWLGPLGWNATVLEWIAIVVAVAIATFLSMLLGELVPKNFALAAPLATARVVMPVQIAFTAVFRPVVLLFNATANGILKLFGITAKEELTSARTPEELASLVLHSAREGLLESDTAALLRKTLFFSERTAGDVMTPRPRVVAVNANDSVRSVLEEARTSGHSRFPVVEEGLDDLVGVVHVKYALAVPRDRRHEVPVSAIMTEALRVPETMALDNLLTELRAKGYQLAIVVDEYGGSAGLTTLEDVVEELIGEVSDEHDRHRAGVVATPAGISFPASLRPDELKEQTGIVVPEDPDYETIAGFVMRELGALPLVGDEIVGPGGTFRVARMDGRRIDRLVFTPTPAGSVPDGETRVETDATKRNGGESS